MRRFSLKKCWKTSRLLDDSGRSRKGHWCQKRTRKRSAKAQKTAFFDGPYQAIPSSISWAFLSECFESQKLRIADFRSEEHTSELQSLMRTSYAVFCLKKKK